MSREVVNQQEGLSHTQAITEATALLSCIEDHVLGLKNSSRSARGRVLQRILVWGSGVKPILIGLGAIFGLLMAAMIGAFFITWLDGAGEWVGKNYPAVIVVGILAPFMAWLWSMFVPVSHMVTTRLDEGTIGKVEEKLLLAQAAAMSGLPVVVRVAKEDLQRRRLAVRTCAGVFWAVTLLLLGTTASAVTNLGFDVVAILLVIAVMMAGTAMATWTAGERYGNEMEKLLVAIEVVTSSRTANGA